MRKLFVSYARDNKRDVDQLVEHLRMLTYDTWIDKELRGGQVWWEEVLQRVADSDAFIAVISHAALNSSACNREFDWAEALGKPVVPVAIEPLQTALPTRVAQRQIIPYSEPAERAHAALELGGALAKLPPAPPLPERLPEPPEVPLSYLNNLVDLIGRTNTLDYERQHHILVQLERALRSADPEERGAGRDLMERFSRRHGLYADVDRKITQLRNLADVAEPVTTPEPRRRVRPKASVRFSQPTERHDKPAAPPPPDDEPPSPEATTYQSVLRHVWKSTLTSGVIGLVMGVLLVFAAPETLTAATVFVSVYLLTCGVSQVILAYAMFGWARNLLLVSGAASLLFAAVAFVVVQNTSLPSDRPYMVGAMFGMGFLTRGLAEAVSAARARMPGPALVHRHGCGQRRGRHLPVDTCTNALGPGVENGARPDHGRQRLVPCDLWGCRNRVFVWNPEGNRLGVLITRGRRSPCCRNP